MFRSRLPHASSGEAGKQLNDPHYDNAGGMWTAQRKEAFDEGACSRSIVSDKDLLHTAICRPEEAI